MLVAALDGLAFWYVKNMEAATPETVGGVLIDIIMRDGVNLSLTPREEYWSRFSVTAS